MCVLSWSSCILSVHTLVEINSFSVPTSSFTWENLIRVAEDAGKDDGAVGSRSPISDLASLDAVSSW